VDKDSPPTETVSRTETDAFAAPPEPACLGRVSDYLRALGPGLVAGMSDNDPSGVATYAIAGAATGYSLLWLLVLATLIVQAVQASAARLGEVAQGGFIRVARQRYGPSLATVVALAILLTNEATLIADFAALGSSLQLITGLPWQWFILPASAVMLLVVVVSDFRWLRNVVAVVGSLLLAYIVTAFLTQPHWTDALRGTFIPTLPRTTFELATAVALLGTTVSPYLVVWQSEGEREVRRTGREFRLAVVDVTAGYVASNVVSYFIVVTTAATLFQHHQSIGTAADAANALRPLAGPLASVIFGVGLLAAACLSIPIFAIANGYVVCGLLDCPSGLAKSCREAPGFYGVLALTLVSGSGAVLLGVDPIVALFESQVLNGLLMPLIVVILGLLVNDRVVMGESRSTPYYNAWLAVSFVVMAGGAVMLVRSLI
jgi:Mn2+/Fe2+ NRAMP family transporter